MSEYTPTTENVRSVYAHGGAGQTTERRRAMFDRWLAQYTAEKRAEWEAGRGTVQGEPSEHGPDWSGCVPVAPRVV